MTEARILAIRERLEKALETSQLEIIDDSASHAGHVGAQSGAGHFDVIVVSDKFENLGKIARHRLVYEALADMMQSEIHALKISALTPSEMP